MKRLNNIGFALCFILAFAFAIGSVAHAAGPAPLYDGPTVEGKQLTVLPDGVGAARVFRIFYTRDPLKKVAAYYEGKMPKKTSSSPTEVKFDGTEGTPLEYDAVKVWRPGSDLSEFDMFDPLKEEIGKEQAGIGKGHHSQDDLEAVQGKYGYLADEAFFPNFSIEEKLAACRRKTGSGVSNARQDQASLQAKIQELAAQGRFAEMQEYLAKAQGVTSNTNQAMSVSHWDEWVECLDEIEGKAFRTQINIRIK